MPKHHDVKIYVGGMDIEIHVWCDHEVPGMILLCDLK